MNMVNIIINGKDLQVPEGTTILDASKLVGVHIPTLCHLELHDFGVVNQVASCRICVVEVEGRAALSPSCAEKVYEGMEIKTDSVKALNARRNNLELLLSNHPFECLTCSKNLSCELQGLAEELNIREIHAKGEKMSYPIDNSSNSITLNKLLQSNNEWSISSSSSTLKIVTTLTCKLSDKNPSTICNRCTPHRTPSW